MRKMLLAAAILVTACAQEQETDLKLWYDEYNAGLVIIGEEEDSEEEDEE